MPDATLKGLLVALGIGLLIGLDRERHKGEGPRRASAGIRTFALTALIGAIASHLGGEWLIGVALGGVSLLAVLAYLTSPSNDPGLTTEVALILTGLLGALAMREPGLGAALGVAVAVLLHVKPGLHSFVRDTLNEAEVRSGLVFAAATLIVWPLLPDRYMGPFQAINPRALWAVVILIMAIGAAGYVLQRLLGPERGLPVAGFVSGFVSSSATIAAMGARVRDEPATLVPAVAGAVLSSVATIVQLALVLGAISPDTLTELALPLGLAVLAATAYAAVVSLSARDGQHASVPPPGEAFSFKAALVLAGLFAAVLLLSAGLRAWAGDKGTLLAAGAAGLVDTHSAAAAVASLVAAGKMAPAAAPVPVMVALATNTLTKIAMAVSSGNAAFAARVVPGLLLVAAAAWAGLLL